MTVANTCAGQGALDAGVRKTLSNTFVAVGAMWLIASAVSLLTLQLRLGIGMTLALFVASLAVMFGVHRFRTSGIGLALLALFAGLQGVSLGPLLSHYLGLPSGGQMVALAAGLTSLATFACATYCVTTRRSFSRLGGFLFAGLVVVLVACIVGLFVQSTALHLVISVAGSLLFTAYLLYDISRVVNGEEDNYVIAALAIFLNTLNLLLFLLRLFGLLGGDD